MGRSTQADLEARLVAREKELRALAAEKGVLSQQARAAWALLDERSAAAHELEVAPSKRQLICSMLPAMQEDMSMYTVVYTVASTVTWTCLVYEFSGPQNILLHETLEGFLKSVVQQTILQPIKG